MTKNPEILAGLYIHIPFCKKKCFYCDFYSVTDLAQIPVFVAALENEMQLASRVPLVFDTIYIGGGTPSMLEASDVAQIIALAFKYFKIMPGAEVTMEVNPGTATLADLADYRSAGVNRLNIGVQSFQPENLKFLDRIHTAEQALSCLEWARRGGFANVGLDLIYGLPAQDPDIWREDLARAVGIGPEHLSCYMLTRETGTPLDKAVAAAGNKAVVMGNVPTRLFADGTPEEMEAAIDGCIQAAPDNGGYILASGCEIPLNSTEERIGHFFEYGRAAGKKWLQA